MRQSIHLSTLQRICFYTAWVAVAITGVYFAWSQDWRMDEPTDMTVNTLKIHGIAAAVMLAVFGSLASTHIRTALRRHRNKVTGYTILSIMFVLGLTGTGLYYSPESWHDNVKWTHIWIGLISVMIVPIHILYGRYTRILLRKKRES